MRCDQAARQVSRRRCCAKLNFSGEKLRLSEEMQLSSAPASRRAGGRLGERLRARPAVLERRLRRAAAQSRSSARPLRTRPAPRRRRWRAVPAARTASPRRRECRRRPQSAVSMPARIGEHVLALDDRRRAGRAGRRADEQFDLRGQADLVEREILALLRIGREHGLRRADEEGVDAGGQSTRARIRAACDASCASGTRSACPPGTGPTRRVRDLAPVGRLRGDHLLAHRMDRGRSPRDRRRRTARR